MVESRNEWGSTFCPLERVNKSRHREALPTAKAVGSKRGNAGEACRRWHPPVQLGRERGRRQRRDKDRKRAFFLLSI